MRVPCAALLIIQTVPGVFYYKCDITDSAAVTKVAASVREQHGNPSVLINNAGLGMCRSSSCGIVSDNPSRGRRDCSGRFC